MSITASDYRAGMRQLAAAVTVITTVHTGSRAGMTATAVMSLTADPPQLGIAINRSNASFAAIAAAGVFAVNVLTHGQAELADRFAGAGGARGEDRFTLGQWGQLLTGAPVLEDSAASFDCRVVQTVDLGSHHLFVGQVEALRLQPTETPLLFMDGTWASLVRAKDRDFDSYAEVVANIEEALGRAIASGATPPEQLRAFSHDFARISIARVDVLRDFFSREMIVPANRLNAINARKRAVETNLQQLLVSGVSSGDFDIVDPALTADAIIGMMNSVHRWRSDLAPAETTTTAAQFGELVAAMVSSQGAGDASGVRSAEGKSR